MANEEQGAGSASRKQFREMRRGGREGDEGNLRRGIWIALMAG